MDPEMETIIRLSSSLPRKGDAAQMDQVFRPPLPTTPSTGRRRTVGITSELITHEERDSELPMSEQEDYVGSPEQRHDPLGALKDDTTAYAKASVDATTSNTNTTDVSGTLGDQSKNSAILADSTIGMEAGVNADSTTEDTSSTLQANSQSLNGGVNAEPPLSTWMYSYAPNVRQPSSTISAEAQTEDATAGMQPAPPLSDPQQQLMEANVYETTGTVSNSDTKDQIYSRASTDTEPGTQTEQGIGVDSQHRSEVPEGPDQGFTSGDAKAWSVSALASSAWAWGRGRDAVGSETDAKLSKEQKTETSEVTEESSLAVPESSDQPVNLDDNAIPESVPAPLSPKIIEDAEAEPSTTNLPPPGWSGYVGTWLRRSPSTPSGEATSSNLVEAGESKGLPVPIPVSDGAEPCSQQEPDHVNDTATALVHRPANDVGDVIAGSKSEVPPPSRNQLSGINAANEAYLQQHTTDNGRLSRTAWALATATRWVGGIRPATQPENQVTSNGEATPQNGKSTASIAEDQPQPKEARIPTIPSNMQSTEIHRSQQASSFFTAAPSVLMTPELLEARPSPLLPSTTSMLARPNLILPSFNHTFSRPPRGHDNLSSTTTSAKEDHSKELETALRVPFTRQRSPPSMAWRALGAVSQYARGAHKDGDLDSDPGKLERTGSGHTEKNALPLLANSGKERWDGIRRVVIIGVHGWFPNAHVQKVIGAPRGSSYFASMMGQAVLAQFEADFGVGQEAPEKVTYIPLDGEGTVDVRVEKLYKAYLSKDDWVRDVRRADAIFVAAHSQGTIVAAHLLSRLIAQGHIRTAHNADAVARCEWAFGPVVPVDKAKKSQTSSSTSPSPMQKPPETIRLPRIGLLAMCGVHQGPFYSTTASTVIQPYLNWFEGGAARELFELQDNESTVSKEYTKSLNLILHHGVKTIFLASLDDQMVPIYSAVFTAATHPLILRLLYVDAAIHSSTDFMINLIVFCLMLRNAGLDDQGLIGHLSEATAGAWRGAGHSTPYEDPGAYAFMVKYLLSTTAPDPDVMPELQVEEFTAKDARNDYELPWTLRGVMDDSEIKMLFDAEISELKENILDWQPTTRALKDIKKRLEPMAGRAALRQHQQKQRLRRTSSFLSLASSDGQISARKQDESLSSSPHGEGVQRKGQGLAGTTGTLHLQSASDGLEPIICDGGSLWFP
ncbi:hypothetical protein QFC21_006009 [Naganishia friedmannii]|uniref:Uncharacterized protein n=1 Tax=Naganishia friedmannii TaxID=89922 RepID=A0ACC2V6D0_9TREE|nr:hypothetical protein QFC21_006009 [Naganishia friedmannii]